MTKKVLFTYCFCLFCLSLVYIACSDDDDGSAISHPSYRDGVYEGEKLSVTLDGKEVPTIEKVTLTSEFLKNRPIIEPHTTSTGAAADPTYTTVDKVIGFPTKRETTTFETISDMEGFSGTTTIANITYDYTATFTGHPLDWHKNQGLILQFTTK